MDRRPKATAGGGFRSNGRDGIGARVWWWVEVLGWAAVAAVVLSAVVLVPHNLRLARAHRAARQLPPGVRQRVLDALKALPLAGSRMLVPAEGPVPEPYFLESHLGGLPYGEEGDAWPAVEPGIFLIQVRLEHPGLGPGWQGRLVVVFLQYDEELVVRSYGEPTLGKARPLRPPASVATWPVVPLTAVNLPVGEGEEACNDPALLVRKVPALADILGPCTHDVAGLLAPVLEPGRAGYSLPPESTVLVGGQPQLIQNPHDARCAVCREPMRYLFQFGEVLPGVDIADAAVSYVYGCDHHPEQCRAFLDSH